MDPGVGAPGARRRSCQNSHRPRRGVHSYLRPETHGSAQIVPVGSGTRYKAEPQRIATVPLSEGWLEQMPRNNSRFTLRIADALAIRKEPYAARSNSYRCAAALDVMLAIYAHNAVIRRFSEPSSLAFLGRRLPTVPCCRDAGGGVRRSAGILGATGHHQS